MCNLRREASLAVERIVLQSTRREKEVVQSVLEAVRVVLLLHVAKPVRPGVRSGAETWRHDGADSAELAFGSFYAVPNILSARLRRYEADTPKSRGRPRLPRSRLRGTVLQTGTLPVCTRPGIGSESVS